MAIGCEIVLTAERAVAPQFALLGPLEVRLEDGEIELRRSKARVLLAALLLRLGKPASVDGLIDDLWGDDAPATAPHALHNAVCALRKVLGADVVVTNSGSYGLAVAPEQVDSVRFQRLTESAALAGSPVERAVQLRAALSLWRGAPLADLAFEPCVLREAPRLERLRLAARADLMETELALGHHLDVVPELEAMTEEHPFDERLRAMLMLALYRSGRQADALQAYRRTREFLLDDLGLEPNPQLRALHTAILTQDDSLAAPTQAPPVGLRKTISFCPAGRRPQSVIRKRRTGCPRATTVDSPV
jgi:DNA-binding SARP family transcriptional activator